MKEIDFEREVFSKPTYEQAEALSEILIAAREKFIPSKQITIRSTDQPWSNNFTRLLLRRKNRNYLMFKKASIKCKNYLNNPNANDDISNRLKNQKQKAFENFHQS